MKKLKLFHWNIENKDHTSALSIVICRRFFSPIVRFRFCIKRVLPNFINFEFTVFNLTILEIGYIWGVK